MMEGDPNLSVVIETLTKHGREQIMAQKFLPEISDGDKRILMVNGEPVPYALARIPKAGEARGNLAAGGTGVGRPLTERDRWIAEQVGPELVRRGLLFVGIDVIGDYLTEVNVTCPTCIRELDAQFGLDIGAKLVDCIEIKLTEQGRDTSVEADSSTLRPWKPSSHRGTGCRSPSSSRYRYTPPLILGVGFAWHVEQARLADHRGHARAARRSHRARAGRLSRAVQSARQRRRDRSPRNDDDGRGRFPREHVVESDRRGSDRSSHLATRRRRRC